KRYRHRPNQNTQEHSPDPAGSLLESKQRLSPTLFVLSDLKNTCLSDRRRIPQVSLSDRAWIVLAPLESACPRLPAPRRSIAHFVVGQHSVDHDRSLVPKDFVRCWHRPNQRGCELDCRTESQNLQPVRSRSSRVRSRQDFYAFP